LSLRNDLGLLAEEWDSRLQRQVGNFPQAFSHAPLIDTALAIDKATRARHALAEAVAAFPKQSAGVHV
ncbi:glycoside hydrolase family 15 protein, partial [Streptomyces sp. NPDC001787]